MQLVQWSDYWENEGPWIVRCEEEVAWKRVSGNELCREREGGEGRGGERGEAGGAGALGHLARRRAAARGSAGSGPNRGHRTPVGVVTWAPPPHPRPRPTPAAWHSSKSAPDCYALCFLLRAEPGGMGLAQAVSLPRGGGTLKGQRPLPAAARPPPPPPPSPPSPS